MEHAKRKGGWFRRAVALVVAAGIVLGAHPSLGAGTPLPRSSSVAKGTITFANAPGSSPNYIFPFMPLSYFSIANGMYFQHLMYRPLYWFGTGEEPTLNLRFSLADAPVYGGHDRFVTIELKPYVWSDGEPVVAEDVAFWLNMYRTNPLGYGAYVPGGIPDDVANVLIESPRRLTLVLKSPVNPYWFTYNELSQITPMPMAWDVTARGAKAGSQLCARAPFRSIMVKAEANAGAVSIVPISQAARSCEAVYDFLSEQSGYDPTHSVAPTNAFATYATSKIWSVVDGPWKLASFSPTGNDVFVPNRFYRGPVKPTYARLVIENFPSDTAEANALFAHEIDIGYLSTQDIIAPARGLGDPGANNPRLAPFYRLVEQPLWSISFALFNFTAKNDGGLAGRILSQLYLREAMQEMVDQPVVIDKVLKGYGTPTYGPVPVLPKSPFVTKAEASDPYPYNPAKVRQLLVSHGWLIDPGGTDVCELAQECGVPKGAKLALTMLYTSDVAWLATEVVAEDEAWRSIGINVSLRPGSFTEVFSNAVPSNHGWDLADYGFWMYAPAYYPSGEELFETGAAANAGSYSNKTADRLIRATQVSANEQLFARYENFLALQLPRLWQVSGVGVVEVSRRVSGYVPSSLDSILPETWHLER
jgi:peptide/nickel transport system substrate-binding protein